MKWRATGPIEGNVPEFEGLVFFAQLLDEMTFDFTMDTYKPSAMSAALLCTEALRALDLVEQQRMERAAIKSILEELLETLRRDPVCRELLDLEPDTYVRFAENDQLSDLHTRLRLLQHRVRATRYLQEAERQLIEKVKSPKEKKDIRALARSWSSALLGSGFHLSFMRQLVHDFFFNPERPLSSQGLLEAFFEAFKGPGKAYHVIFRVSALFRDLAKSCERFNASLETIFPESIAALPQEWVDAADPQQWLVLPEIEAREPHSAKRRAEMYVELMCDMFTLFHHKQRLSWNDEALVVDSETKKQVFIRSSNRPITRILDNRPEKAARKMHKMLEKFSFRNADEAKKFTSIIRLHGVAAEVESVDVQLVNLWTAFEVTIPSGGGSKLRAVTDALVPFLLIRYPEAILEDLTADLARWDFSGFRSLLKRLELGSAKRLCHRLAAVLLDPANQPLCDELFDLVADFPLLRFRCFSVQDRFRTPEIVIVHNEGVVCGIALG